MMQRIKMSRTRLFACRGRVSDSSPAVGRRDACGTNARQKNVPRASRLLLAVALLCLASTASAAYVDFVGKNGDPTVGDLTNPTNWPGIVLPSGSETGRVVQANNIWVGIAKDILVRLEGGRIGAVGGGIGMRGNALFEIDAGDWSSTTNLDVSAKMLTMWSQDGGTNELNILNGRVAAGDLNMVSPGKSIVKLGIGVLDVDYWKACKGAVHMLSGGSGSIDVASVNSNANFLADCSFNFETGNRGSITLGEIEGGTSAVGTWEALIADGNISIDTVATTAVAAFSITNSGTSTTIQLAGVVEVADLWVPSIFSRGMVLQSGQPVPVWGEGEPGETITVSFKGQVEDVVVGGAGRWSATLDALAVSMTGATLNVSASGSLQTKTFTDVLVGEVWLLSGQSNMALLLQSCEGGTNDAAAANYPWLRVFDQTSGEATEPAGNVEGGHWFTCAPANAGQISGVGFYFARALQASLPTNTPIALVNTQVGGTWIEQWVDIDTISAIPAAQPFIVLTNLPDPSLLYNGRVAPLQPFGIGGVIWYQGEGNTMATLDSAGYVDELKGLVTSWRQQWNDADLPFLVVQLPRYHAEDWSRWPEVRNAQAQAAHDMDGVEVAVTIDLGEEYSIHPTEKVPVGERLALLARAKVYGEAVDCYGPFFQSSEIAGSDVLVEWAYADGLVFSNGVAQGFEICGSDGVFVSAQAEILPDNRVRVYSAGVPEPAGVRYGWFNWGEVSLFNGLGLPAAPFSWTPPPPGLTVVNGTLYKEGKPYRAAGMNYCDLFQAMINFPEYTGQTEYRTMEGLEFLGEQGIPFVRFWACGFWPSNWDLYFSDKAEWFSRMDLLVATAEAADVGLIPSLFWRTSTISELMGEYRDAWGDPNSLTRQFMTNYVHEVVGRYKDSPAIWGWEFANEMNLGCDLPNWDDPSFWSVIPQLGVVGPATDYTSESNRMTYVIAESAFNAFSQEVRKLDTHRFITTGSSNPRNNSWNNQRNDSWTVDSYAEAKEAFGWMQPASIDMASVHVYPKGAELEYADASGTANVLLRYREFCDDQNQAMFVGEYSSFNGDESTTLDEKRASEDALLNNLIASGADLMAFWVFDYTYNRTNAGLIREDNDYTWVLDAVRDTDAKMRGEQPLSLAGVPVDWFDQNGIAPTGSLTLAQVEMQDLNGNGLMAWEDYMVGFQPLETGTVFSITDFQWLENSVPNLSWQGGTNGLMTPYVIQSSTNLLDAAAWQTIDTHAREQGENIWTGTTTDDPTGYYRVLATP